MSLAEKEREFAMSYHSSQRDTGASHVSQMRGFARVVVRRRLATQFGRGGSGLVMTTGKIPGAVGSTN